MTECVYTYSDRCMCRLKKLENILPYFVGYLCQGFIMFYGPFPFFRHILQIVFLLVIQVEALVAAVDFNLSTQRFYLLLWVTFYERGVSIKVKNHWWWQVMVSLQTNHWDHVTVSRLETLQEKAPKEEPQEQSAVQKPSTPVCCQTFLMSFEFFTKNEQIMVVLLRFLAVAVFWRFFFFFCFSTHVFLTVAVAFGLLRSEGSQAMIRLYWRSMLRERNLIRRQR